MGGNTFKSPAVRLTSAEHAALTSYVRFRLKNVFDPIAAVPYLASKSSHGDLDLICGWNGIGTSPGKGGSTGDAADVATEDINLADASITLDSPSDVVQRWCTGIAAALGGARWLRSGQELSVAVPVTVLDACESHRDVPLPESPSIATVPDVTGVIAEPDTIDKPCVTLCGPITTPTTINDDEIVSNASSGTIPPPSTPIELPGSPTSGHHDEARSAPPSSPPQTESSEPLTAPQVHAPFYQVDLILCPSGAVPFAVFSQSYGMMALLFSHYVRRATGVHGVCLQMPCVLLRTRPFTSYKKVDVVLSTDPGAVCEWLGLDYGAWKDTPFETTQDLFRWLASVQPGSRGERAIKLLANRGPSSRSKSCRMVVLDEFGAWLRSNGWGKVDNTSEVLNDKPSEAGSRKMHSPSVSRTSTCTTATSSTSASTQSDLIPAPLTDAEKAVLEYWGQTAAYTMQVDALIRERDLVAQQMCERRERREREKTRQEKQQTPGEETVVHATETCAPAPLTAETSLAAESAFSVKKAVEAELIILTLPAKQDMTTQELEKSHVLSDNAAQDLTNQNSDRPASPHDNVSASPAQNLETMDPIPEELPVPKVEDQAASPVHACTELPFGQQDVVDQPTWNVIVDSPGDCVVVSSTDAHPPSVVEPTPDLVQGSGSPDDAEQNEESSDTQITPVKPSIPQNVVLYVETVEATATDEVPPVVEVAPADDVPPPTGISSPDVEVVPVDDAASHTGIISPGVEVVPVDEVVAPQAIIETSFVQPLSNNTPQDDILGKDAPQVTVTTEESEPVVEVDSEPVEKLHELPSQNPVPDTADVLEKVEAPDATPSDGVGSGEDIITVTPTTSADDAAADLKASASHTQETPASASSAPTQIEQEATVHQQVIAPGTELPSGSSSGPLPETPNVTPESRKTPPKGDKDTALTARTPPASDTKWSIIGKKDKSKGNGKRDSCVIA